MSLIINTSDDRFKKVILKKFKLLSDLFDFNPNNIPPYKIEVNIIGSLEEFLKTYEKEYKTNPPEYVVGFAASNGRVFILNKDLFEKKGHSKQEFEKVIVHELSHIFLRRILDPKSTFMWITEGICQYLAFKGDVFRVSNFIDFKKLESREDWRKFHPYQQSAAFFKFLSNNYGIEKIIQFIKLIKYKEEYEAFDELFGDFKEVQEKFLRSLKPKNENTTSSRNTL